MGAIKTTEQDNQNLLLEITYGGKEAPFGGIDSSMPPAYIDPRCFAAADGVMVIDGKLCFVNWTKLTLPTLFGGASATLLKIGTFYNSVYGQLNYALGVDIESNTANPPLTVYTFYLTAWTYNQNMVATIVGNDKISPGFYPSSHPAAAASLTILPVAGEASNFTDSGSLGVVLYNNGTFVASTGVSYAPGATLGSLIPLLVTTINAAAGFTTYVTAAATVDGTGIILTAKTAGAAGNLLAVFDGSASSTTGDSPAFYIGNTSNATLGAVNFQGGSNAYNLNPPSSFSNLSTVSIGGTLYISNVGPMVLKYSGPGKFAVSSMYSGYKVLAKYAGYLLGLGSIPQSGVAVQNSDMILSWTANGDFDIWSPINVSNGQVTGAGFEQLADIGDALSGVVVSNGTAYIIRKQGVSYAAATGNATLPLQINHLGLGDEGEGAQISQLITQYDQVGAFVGNSNVYQLANGMSPIGDKIKTLLFTAVQGNSGGITAGFGAVANAMSIGGDVDTLVIFVIGNHAFIFNTSSGTWTIVSWLPAGTGVTAIVGLLCVPGPASSAFVPVIAATVKPRVGPSTITAMYLSEAVSNSNSQSPQQTVTFPQEEVMFGRDITIDALYVSLVASVTENVQLNIYISGVLYNTITLTSVQFNTLQGAPIELQVFPTSTPFTAHSPQLSIQSVALTDTSINIVRFVKIAIFGSFDPNQRPV